jgi:hypothetical protein
MNENFSRKLPNIYLCGVRNCPWKYFSGSKMKKCIWCCWNFNSIQQYSLVEIKLLWFFERARKSWLLWLGIKLPPRIIRWWFRFLELDMFTFREYVINLALKSEIICVIHSKQTMVRYHLMEKEIHKFFGLCKSFTHCDNNCSLKNNIYFITIWWENRLNSAQN